VSDIVERLRQMGDWIEPKVWQHDPTAWEAADGIERLRKEVDFVLADRAKQIERKNAGIEWLRDNLDRMRLTAETFAAKAGQARNDALEEAVKVADAWRESAWQDEFFAGQTIAAAIRALKEKADE
jgi:hypothetical protein